MSAAAGEVAPPERRCGKERAHGGPHTWLEQASPPGVGLVQRRCPGRPAAAAAFADHRYVDVRRCYQTGEDGPCRRMLVTEEPDGFVEVPALGWTMREWRWPGFGSEREWRCPQHSVT